jgi:hypothetical protein
MNNQIKLYEDGKWKVEEFKWGFLGKIDDSFRDSDKLKYWRDDYWPIAFSNKWRAYSNKIIDSDIDFELKYWEFKEKDVDKEHCPKIQRNAVEYNFILEGEIIGYIEDSNENKKDICLKAGDFIVIQPGFLINLQKNIVKNTKGITIKIPGIKNDTFKINNFKYSKI